MSDFNLFYKNKAKFQLDLSSNKEIIEYLKRLGYPLLFILKNQNIELCIEAINQKYYTCDAMKEIQNQTEEMCLLAVKQNGMALQFVKNQTEQICLLAVKQNGMALQFVKNQTNEICLSAVQQNGMALQFVNDKEYKLLFITSNINIKKDDICSICITQNDSEWCEILDCLHVFHKECLLRWLEEKNICPNCRKTL